MGQTHIATSTLTAPAKAPARRQAAAMKRDALVALSLANLSYLRIWSELLTYRRADTYLMKAPPPPAAYAAVVVNVLIIGLLLWLAATAARRYLSPAGFGVVEALFLLSVAVPLNALRAVLSNHFEYLKSPLFELIGTRGVSLLAMGLLLAAAAVIVFWHRRAAHVAAAVLAAFVPLAPITFAQAAWKAVQYNDAALPGPPAALLATGTGAARVVWIICDEWDYRLSFDDRARGLRLPEIDRLRAETVFASHAYPPGPATPVSMPAYITGRPVKYVEYRGPDELLVHFRDSRAELWGRQPDVFSRAHEMGFNTAVIGWFHPYCRVLHGNLTFCDWWEMARQHNTIGRTFWPAVPNQTRSLFETTLFSPFGQSLSVRQQVETHHAILASARKIANDPQFGLSLIHLPIPHAPHGYSRTTGRFDLRNAPIRGYMDSLALLDKTLGDLRRSMEASGMWTNTTVLVTTDHPYREAAQVDGKSDRRIPFLLKLAGQRAGTSYDAPFNAVLTHDLLLAVLGGRIGDTAGAVRWLDTNRARVPLD